MNICNCSDLPRLYSDGDNHRFFFRLNPRAKVIATILALAAILTSPYMTTSLVLGAASTVILVNAGFRGPALLKRLAFPIYMALVIVITQVFWSGSAVFFSIGPFSAKSDGLIHGLLLASRVTAGNLAILVLATTTSPVDLLSAARWLRFPRVLVEMAALIYRYLFLLLDEAQTLWQAQRVRLGYCNWKKGLNSTSTLFAMVLIRTYDRTGRVYEAMAARGYAGEMPVPERVKGNGYIPQAVALGLLPAFCWLGGFLRIWPF